VENRLLIDLEPDGDVAVLVSRGNEIPDRVGVVPGLAWPLGRRGPGRAALVPRTG